ncbi:uncharacterized protein LOC120540144 isoform X2 [Polypterus senegalus]|uniref:uncharacterized protein LOC120540144 isoform X2 n=1 Tax=Polypterus senegalus TaxID=55291 RepID=UPI001963B2DA|nr:uncharacterized protein LOC120540144 isoform X2 [Polypterus senegalus]
MHEHDRMRLPSPWHPSDRARTRVLSFLHCGSLSPSLLHVHRSSACTVKRVSLACSSILGCFSGLFHWALFTFHWHASNMYVLLPGFAHSSLLISSLSLLLLSLTDAKSPCHVAFRFKVEGPPRGLMTAHCLTPAYSMNSSELAECDGGLPDEDVHMCSTGSAILLYVNSAASAIRRKCFLEYEPANSIAAVGSERDSFTEKALKSHAGVRLFVSGPVFGVAMLLMAGVLC